MAPRRAHNRSTRLWLPPLMNLALSAFVVQGLALLSGFGAGGFWMRPDALYLAFPLFYLRLAHGLPQVVFTALALDAYSMGPYGTRLVLFCICMALFLPLRVRVRRENPLSVFWVAMVMSLFLSCGQWCVAQFWPAHIGAVPLVRILVDSLASALFCGAAAFWWMQLQRSMIYRISGEDPASYQILS